jgi:hypothetical protein
LIRKDWYSPQEIVPTMEQLEDFILPNLEMLRGGTYPTDPREAGRPGSGERSCARFVPAAELAAEIDARLVRIPKRVAITLHYTVQPAWTYAQIARELNMDEEKLEMEMFLMLKYLVGKDRKVDDFAVWKSKRKKKVKITV